MRFMVCEWIWNGFDVLHRHLLLMMDFDCPFAFCHKKGEYILKTLCFCFQGESIFCWLELVGLFRLYVGASLCILFFFSSCHICFALLGYSC